MNNLKQYFFDHVIPFLGRVFLSKNDYVNVIYYHDIVEDKGYSLMQMNIEKFKHQMLYIKKQGYETLRFDDLNTPSLFKFKKKRVVIAFDDGWKSNYALIFDWMKEQGIKYNIYLTIGEIGNNPEYLTWDQVRMMHESGVCGFGAHTFTHPDMSDLTKVDINIEVQKANEIFEKELGYKPMDFCYPFGYYSEASNEWLTQNTDYRRIYTSAPFFSYKQKNSYIMARQGISNDDTDKAFHDKLNGYNNIYKPFFDKYYKIFSK